MRQNCRDTLRLLETDFVKNAEGLMKVTEHMRSCHQNGACPDEEECFAFVLTLTGTKTNRLAINRDTCLDISGSAT